MKNWRFGLFLTVALAGGTQSYLALGQTEIKCRPTSPLNLFPARVINSEDIIHHDPDADFKQSRGQIHNRTYLAKKLASFHLKVDSLQDEVDRLNLTTKDKEWEYQVSTLKGSEGRILKFYKSHKNADGSSGTTIYGEERRRWPDR